MNQGKTVFAQIMSLIPRYEFDKCVKRYNGNRHAIEFKCRDQFMVMSFASSPARIVACAALMQRWLPCPLLYSSESTYPTLDFGTYQRDQGLAHLSRLRSDIDFQARYLYHHEPSRLDVTESSMPSIAVH